MRDEKNCYGKVRFSSMTLAQKTAHRQAHNRHRKFKAYHCKNCGGFHVGSMSGKPKDMRRELKELSYGP